MDNIVNGHAKNNGNAKVTPDYFLQPALNYAKRGYKVVDVYPVGHERGDKTPVGSEWQLFATDHPPTIKERFSTLKNVGVLLGPKSGIIDIDPDSPEAEACYQKYFNKYDPVPTYKSGRGTKRIWAYDERLEGIGIVHIDDVLEVRIGASRTPDGKHAGIQSILPPSVAYNDQGQRVERVWLAGMSLDDVQPKPLPDEIVELILAAHRQETERDENHKRAVAAGDFQTDTGKPAQDYNKRADWQAILKPHGWQYLYASGDIEHWRRPGKGFGGASATIGYGGLDRLYVFSFDAAPFQANNTYSKFDAYCILNHEGNKAAALSAIENQGYGKKAKQNKQYDDLLAFFDSHPAEPMPKATLAQQLQQPDPHILKNDPDPVAVAQAEPPTVNSVLKNDDPTLPPTKEQQHEALLDKLLSGQRLKDRAAMRRRERLYIAEGWIQAGKQHLLSGPAKRGKSTLMFDYAAAALTGTNWIGCIPVKKSPVIFVDYENEEDYIVDNLEPMLRARDSTFDEVGEHVFLFDPNLIFGEEALANPLDATAAIEFIEAVKWKTGCAVGTFVVDTARAAFNKMYEAAKDGGNWEITPTYVRRVCYLCRAIAKATGWAVILIHHHNKSGNTSGSGDWRGASEITIDFERPKREDKAKLYYEGRSTEPPAPLQIEKEGLHLTATPLADIKAEKQKEKALIVWDEIINCLGKGEGNKVSTAEIHEALEDRLSKDKINTTLKELQEDGERGRTRKLDQHTSVVVKWSVGKHNKKYYWYEYPQA